MSRQARMVVPGYPHHITQRGNRRQKTFFEPGDYRLYLKILEEQCQKTGLNVWAYCLMPNHVHLIVVPPTENALRKGIGETHRRYTRAINEKMEWRGYLWQGRFTSSPMDESYLLATARYVELNPVKAAIVDRPDEYLWSSARFHLQLSQDSLLLKSPLRSAVGNWRDFLMMDEDEKETRKIRVAAKSGKPLGTDKFLEDIHNRGHNGNVSPVVD